jgi:alkylation response protein AidB-like acyl-CoA dehydrogenase
MHDVTLASSRNRPRKSGTCKQSLLISGVSRARPAKSRQFGFVITVQKGIWGAPPSRRYDELAGRFRPVFRRIREGALARERDRTLPFEQIRWRKDARFGTLRAPEEYGGLSATLPETFALLAELAEANSNLTQAFAYREDVLNSSDRARRGRWFKRFANGDIVGGAWAEIGAAKMASFSTRVSETNGRLSLSGAKYYTTGSIFADWIDVGTVNGASEAVSAVVAVKDPGVNIVDDWDGFGQRLTASGTATFTDVPVEPEHAGASRDRRQAFWLLGRLRPAGASRNARRHRARSFRGGG